MTKMASNRTKIVYKLYSTALLLHTTRLCNFFIHHTMGNKSYVIMYLIYMWVPLEEIQYFMQAL